MTTLKGVENHAEKLLVWYDREGRVLPWRYKGDQHHAKDGQKGSQKEAQKVNPYHVWLSEIMLQQTTVTAVIPYFTKFLKQWPCVTDLAEAPLDDVLTQWAGLGYYARARNLHKCAQVIADDFKGVFPEQEETLLSLPGIGPYTSAAIASIAFNHYAVVVDGNVERVVSRIFQVEVPLPESRTALKVLAGDLTPPKRAGDYAQAMMDLGATICTPRSPSCLICPVSDHCAGLTSGLAATLPNRKKKAPKPRRLGACFFVKTASGAILLHKRPDKGLLAKMAEIPTTPWKGNALKDGGQSAPDDFLSLCPFEMPFEAKWKCSEQNVEHVFTHFHLTLQVYVMRITENESDLLALPDSAYYWVEKDKLNDEPLPSLMQKVIKMAQSELDLMV